ncbi:MAG: hypothetical protein KGS09_20230 [Nitrospirae bacterium]|nr:hypothetical protein [Nitrospirota bacterium]MDE3041630.1 hypothetical protein [Nitrospirota bacterium]MDE3219016.1 hypothetical protein [Nitrospirota bacterium]
MSPSTPETALQPAPRAPDVSPHLDGLVHDMRVLLDELQWFIGRDWQQIVRDPSITKALIRRSTKAALLSEDIQTHLIQYLKFVRPNETAISNGDGSESSEPQAAHSDSLIQVLETPAASPDEPEDPPRVTEIPVSVDRVELYEFGRPHEHEHPLYQDHNVVTFCAAFYHEDEFIFARAHLQLLLTPAGLLNWLAGARSIPVDRSYQPLPYTPGGEMFATLGQGITQLIYAHQTELKMKIKQGHRFPADYKLNGMVMPGTFESAQQAPVNTSARQQPAWINTTA